MSHVEARKVIFKGANLVPLLVAVAVGMGVWLVPRPEGLEAKAWQLLAIFVALIVGLVGKALPMGGMSFLALTVLLATKTLTIKEAFTGFSNPVVWLVVSAFLLSRSFVKTRLGVRIAYHLVRLLGRRAIGLGYGIAASEFILAPAIPSNTARAGGILFPIVRALSVSFGSTPERHSQRLIGSFLILTAYYCNLITSALFITAMAANPLIVGFLQQEGIHISWGLWTLAALVPGMLSLLIIPYLVYRVYPPELKDTSESQQHASERLSEMGKMTFYETLTLVVFAALIFLWIFGDKLLGWDSTTVALLGVSIFIVTGVLTWEDIKQEHEAWDALVWFSTLTMIAGFLTQFGLITWMSEHMQSYLQGTSWHMAWLILVLIYFYSHYLFASNTAHVTSMFVAFFNVGIALGVPVLLLGLSLAYSSSLFACLTHYGTGCAPILFGSEYVNIKTWWRIGAIVSVVFLVLWIGVGSVWWKILGLW